MTLKIVDDRRLRDQYRSEWITRRGSVESMTTEGEIGGSTVGMLSARRF